MYNITLYLANIETLCVVVFPQIWVLGTLRVTATLDLQVPLEDGETVRMPSQRLGEEGPTSRDRMRYC